MALPNITKRLAEIAPLLTKLRHQQKELAERRSALSAEIFLLAGDQQAARVAALTSTSGKAAKELADGQQDLDQKIEEEAKQLQQLEDVRLAITELQNERQSLRQSESDHRSALLMPISANRLPDLHKQFLELAAQITVATATSLDVPVGYASPVRIIGKLTQDMVSDKTLMVAIDEEYRNLVKEMSA